MCSNTSLSSGCNGNNGDAVAHHGRVIYSKKPKRPRVPKRGPGVAELEKILREQENKNDFFHNNNEGFPLFSSFSRSPVHIPSFKSPSKPDQVSASDYLERFSPSKIAVTKEDTRLRVSDGHVKKSVQIAGSRILLPEHSLLPTIWNSSDQYSTNPANGLPGTNQQFQRVQYSPPSIIDVFQHPAVSSAATTSAASGLRDSSTEPPSNQASYPHFNSYWPDEDKMVGTKRLRSYSMDLPDIPAFPLPHPSYCHQKSRIDTSLPYLVNFQPTDAVSRDLKMDGSLEPNSRSQIQQRNAAGDQSVEKKPVYSYCNKKDQTNFNLNDEAYDAEEDAIDLNLKL